MRVGNIIVLLSDFDFPIDPLAWWRVFNSFCFHITSLLSRELVLFRIFLGSPMS